MSSKSQASASNDKCEVHVGVLLALLIALLTLGTAVGCSSSEPGATESAGVNATSSKPCELERITCDTNKPDRRLIYGPGGVTAERLK